MKITDSYPFNISIIQHGDAKIVLNSVVYPATVEINTPFTIGYNVVNDGALDSIYGTIKVNGTEVVGSSWVQNNVPTGTIIVKSFNHPGIAVATNFVIEVGHI